MPMQVNAGRSTALQELSANGTLLVFCSLTDNMPYVVAEAAASPPCLNNLYKWQQHALAQLHM